MNRYSPDYYTNRNHSVVTIDSGGHGPDFDPDVVAAQAGPSRAQHNVNLDGRSIPPGGGSSKGRRAPAKTTARASERPVDNGGTPAIRGRRRSCVVSPEVRKYFAGKETDAAVKAIQDDLADTPTAKALRRSLLAERCSKPRRREENGETLIAFKVYGLTRPQIRILNRAPGLLAILLERYVRSQRPDGGVASRVTKRDGRGAQAASSSSPTPTRTSSSAAA